MNIHFSSTGMESCNAQLMQVTKDVEDCFERYKQEVKNIGSKPVWEGIATDYFKEHSNQLEKDFEALVYELKQAVLYVDAIISNRESLENQIMAQLRS